MRFVYKWAYASARHVTLKMEESHEKRRVYYYGLQIVFGGLAKSSLVISISLLTGSLWTTLFLAVVFGSLRMVAGGYHMDTLGKCTLVTLAIFLTGGIAAQYTYMYLSFYDVTIFLIITFAAVMPVIYRWAPAENPNRPITDPKEIKKFKKLSIAYLFVWLAVVQGLTYYDLKKFTIAACLGLIFEAFTITPWGYKFFESISGKLDKAKKKRR